MFFFERSSRLVEDVAKAEFPPLSPEGAGVAGICSSALLPNELETLGGSVAPTVNELLELAVDGISLPPKILELDVAGLSVVLVPPKGNGVVPGAFELDPNIPAPEAEGAKENAAEGAPNVEVDAFAEVLTESPVPPAVLLEGG